jgi:hypothetical protein
VSLLNETSCLTPSLGVTKLINIIDTALVTLCCTSLSLTLDGNKIHRMSKWDLGSVTKLIRICAIIFSHCAKRLEGSVRK